MLSSSTTSDPAAVVLSNSLLFAIPPLEIRPSLADGIRMPRKAVVLWVAIGILLECEELRSRTAVRRGV